MTLPELKAYLAQLDEIRKTAVHELETLRSREGYLRELEAGRDTLSIPYRHRHQRHSTL